ALAIRARHARDVGAPERAVGTERLEDLAQVAVDALVRVRLARIARRARHLDRDVGEPGERQRVLEIGKRRIVGEPGATAVAPEMIDVELQTGMPLGDLGQCGHVAAGEEPDRELRLLARRPEPVDRPVGPPRLLMRLVEGEPKSDHARTLAPASDDLLAIRTLEVEV